LDDIEIALIAPFLKLMSNVNNTAKNYELNLNSSSHEGKQDYGIDVISSKARAECVVAFTNCQRYTRSLMISESLDYK
jgi:hypothetical protein